MILDPDIISLIIQEEKAKKLERDAEYGSKVLYIEPPEYRYEELEEDDGESNRGVVVIDI